MFVWLRDGGDVSSLPAVIGANCTDDVECGLNEDCWAGKCYSIQGSCWNISLCTPNTTRAACETDQKSVWRPGACNVPVPPPSLSCGDKIKQTIEQKQAAWSVDPPNNKSHDGIEEDCENACPLENFFTPVFRPFAFLLAQAPPCDPTCAIGCKKTQCSNGKDDDGDGLSDADDPGCHVNEKKSGAYKNSDNREQHIKACGNGYTESDADPLKNEECDDENTVSGDGCSNKCKNEGPPPPAGAICCFDKCTEALFADNDDQRALVQTYAPGCVFWGDDADTIAGEFQLGATTIVSAQVAPSEAAAKVQCGSPTLGAFSCGDICMERNPPPDPDDETLWFAKDCFDECRDVSFVDPIKQDECSEYIQSPISNKYVGRAGTCSKVLCVWKNTFQCNSGVFTECAKCGDGPQQEEFWESGYCDCTQTDANEGYCYEETVGGASKTVYHIDFQCVDMGDHSSCLLPGSGGYTGGTGGGGLSGTTGGNTGGGTTGTTSGQTSGTTGGTTGGTTAGTTGGTSGGKTTGGTAGTTGGTTSGGGSSASDDTSSAGSTPISSRRSSSQVSKRQESSHPGERGYCCDSDKVCRQREGCTQTFFNCLVECSGISVPSSSSSSDASVSHSSSSSSSSHPSSGSSISRSSATSITSISRSSTPSSGTSSIRVSSVSTERSSASSSRSSESSNSSRRSSSRTSSRSNSSRSFSLGISCLGDECSIGGSQFCSIQNMTCVQTSGLPCIRCVGSTSSIFVSNNCRGDECDLGGDAFCSVQGAACVSTPGFPCIQCIPIIISSAFSSRSITIEVPSFSSRPQIVLEVSCGNGTLDLGEGCDDGNNYPGDGCSPDCEREFCGNGRLDTGESCDNGERNSNNPNAECRTDCTPGRCGDNIQDTPLELCDDGNTTNGDGCDASCQLERTGPNTLPAQIIELPFQLPSSTSYTTTYVPPSTPEPPTNTDTGPAALLVMISGAAAGYAWMKRRVGK